MNFVKKIYAKGILTVLDFGAESVVVLMAEKKENGSFKIVGAGDAVPHGVEAGEIINPGDATEVIVEALKKAERSSGTKIEKIYYNFDDVETQSVISRGSVYLSGDGEIRASDIEEARKVAERLIGNFEKTILYSQAVQFVIDDRDTVVNPIGVFGKKLEVFVHALQARASHCEAWQKLMNRAQIYKTTAIPSAWSTAYGILPKSDRNEKRLIFDLGKDFFNAFIFTNHRIAGYRVLLGPGAGASRNGELEMNLTKEFISANPDIQEVLITGDLAQDSETVLGLGLPSGIPSRVAAPQEIAKLQYPRYASVAGLLSVADEIESQMPMLRAEKNILSNVKEKAISFINEYF